MNGPGRLYALGQSIWLDDLRRDLLEAGTLARYLEEWAVTGLTSNPTIFDAAISQTGAYDDALRDLVLAASSDRSRSEPEALFFELGLDEVVRVADLLVPVHRRTAGVDGWVSFEVSPLLAHDSQGTLQQAGFLHHKAARPNVMIKIPGTVEGLLAIEEATYAGIPVNVTLLFSPAHYQAAAEAYLRGLERRAESGLDLDVRSVASVFVSRWDRAVADRVPETLRNRLGLTMAGLAYAAYRELLESDRWQRLANLGARPQRLLFASTSTKDPGASDVLYMEALAAPQTVITVPEPTLRAFADHGRAEQLLSRDAEKWEEVLAAFTGAGIEVNALSGELQRQGVEAFAASWRHLLDTISQKAAAVRTAR